MIFYPNFYYKSVPSIELEKLADSGIKGIILDVDNTLIDYYKTMPDGIKEWVSKAKDAGFLLCILSNTNKTDKVSKVAEDLELTYFMSAKKPLKSGFYKALNYLKLKAEECVVVGDQIFTDVYGANRLHIHSLYVEPVSKKDFWYTAWKRPLEGLILRKFLKDRKEM